MEGWVKIHRKLLEWEWYRDNNVKIVFLHLLLVANHTEQKWRGLTIFRGQKLTSIEHLAKETNLSVMQVRTALKKLKSTNEITIETTNKNTLITIEKYNDYQLKEFENNKQNNKPYNNEITNEQQTNNKQITTNKNEKNIKNDKNEKEIYINLLNKYKTKINEKPSRKILIIGELKKEEQYESLNQEKQSKLFNELISYRTF